MGKRRPNVIIFLTDDQGYGDCSKTGNENLSTPIIDKLELDGAKLDNFYVCPMCAPTRSELLTGRQFIKTGVYGVTKKAEYINLDETTIADVYKEAGYKTGCFGKWHSGSLYPYHPNARGFDEFYGFCCGHWGYYFDTTMDLNGTEVKGNGYIIDDVTDHAIDFIDKNADEEFLCYIPYNTPHSPYQVPPQYFDKFKDMDLISRADDKDAENTTITKVIMAMCENIDYNMGRVLDKLREKNLENDTIIMYLSDNGPTGTVRYNSGLKGMKSGIDEGSVRTCASITWKNHIKENTVINQLSSSMDILPTMSSLCKIPCKTTHPMDGMDLSALLLGRSAETAKREVFALQNGDTPLLSVRTQKYRYLLNSDELYDIERDRGQKNNLANTQKDVAKKLRETCENFLTKFVPKSHATRYLPIGYAGRKAYLNVQDSNPEGKITWSSIHPNCSYLINWDDDKDKVRWTVDAENSGIYTAKILYTCGKSSVGKTLKLSCKEKACTGKILEEFDPSLHPNRDYSKRSESYTKEFKELCLGEIYIGKGLNDLVLSCIENDGTHICDVRSLIMEIQN